MTVYEDDHRRVVAFTSPESKGGAPTMYRVERTDPEHPAVLSRIHFQPAPIPEVGAQGNTNECLLAIVKHRLECFQAGSTPCTENDEAIGHVANALEALERRTASRQAQHVEGTQKAHQS